MSQFPTATEAAICCMLVSNPAGGKRPDGWQRRVNDLIRAQRDALAEMQTEQNAALETLLEVRKHYEGLLDKLDANTRKIAEQRDKAFEGWWSAQDKLIALLDQQLAAGQARIEVLCSDMQGGGA